MPITGSYHRHTCALKNTFDVTGLTTIFKLKLKFCIPLVFKKRAVNKGNHKYFTQLSPFKMCVIYRKGVLFPVTIS